MESNLYDLATVISTASWAGSVLQLWLLALGTSRDRCGSGLPLAAT